MRIAYFDTSWLTSGVFTVNKEQSVQRSPRRHQEIHNKRNIVFMCTCKIYLCINKKDLLRACDEPHMCSTLSFIGFPGIHKALWCLHWWPWLPHASCGIKRGSIKASWKIGSSQVWNFIHAPKQRGAQTSLIVKSETLVHWVGIGSHKLE